MVAAWFVLASAIAVRASIDFAGPLVPKANGAYYLVQVRLLLEHGRLAFPDLPLVFVIEALAARCIAAFGVASDRAITLSVKLVDTILPALAVVPAVLLSARPRALTPAIAVAFWAVLSASPIAMTGDFQKNAVGMLWFLCLAASLRVALTGSARRGVAAAATFLLLAALTHVGAFGVCLAFAAAAGLASIALAAPDRRRRLAAVAGAGAVLVLAIAALYLAIDPQRLARFASLPLSLFRRPYLIALLGGRVQSPPSALVDLLLVNAISLAALILLVRRRRETPASSKPIVIAALATSLFLGSPLIGAEWAERFHLMAYAPATVLLAFLLSTTRKPSRGLGLAGIVAAAALLGSLPSVARLREPAIPAESYPELESLRLLLPSPARTLLIARHGLEWWAAWALRTKVSQEFDVEPSVWSEYDSVCLLRFVGDPRAPPDQRVRAPSPPRGPVPFPEVRVPEDAVMLHRGRFFELSRAKTPPPFYPLSRPE